MTFLSVYQIYFHQSQLKDLEIDYHPVLNYPCTKYFEHSVIRKLVSEGAHHDCNYFGVVSYNLRNKLGVTKQWKAIFQKNESIREFSPADFESLLQKERPDVACFCTHPAQDMILIAERFHPGFTRHWRELLRRLNLEWTPEGWEWTSYCSFHVAKPEIYEKYVKELLIPAMEQMEKMPELFEPCYYGAKPVMSAELQEQTGLKTWSWHTFIAERLFSYFVHTHGYKGISY